MRQQLWTNSTSRLADDLERLQAAIMLDPSYLEGLDEDCFYLVLTGQAIYSQNGEVIMVVGE